MRRCRINLPNRCYHLISRVAHRAFEGASCESKGSRRYDKENLMWQFTVAIRSDPVGDDPFVFCSLNEFKTICYQTNYSCRRSFSLDIHP